jgi:hypothetical protein
METISTTMRGKVCLVTGARMVKELSRGRNQAANGFIDCSALEAGAFGPGPHQSTTSRHAGSPGLAPVTRHANSPMAKESFAIAYPWYYALIAN